MNHGVCLHTESFTKNLLAILDKLSLWPYGAKTNIPNRFCESFDSDNDEKNTCLFDEALE
jgi:hypothetical protein